MIKIDKAIIVEGKYDKIKLKSFIDGLIIETNGFRIFSDKKKSDMIRRLASEKGLLVITDSDSAGFLIRNHLKSIVPEEQICHAYIPQIHGKEKRKDTPSKEETLGVEGLSEDIIISAIKKSGAIDTNEGFMSDSKKTEDDEKRKLSRMDMYELGLVGQKDSAIKRKKLMKKLNLPEYLSTKALTEVLGELYCFAEIKEML